MEPASNLNPYSSPVGTPAAIRTTWHSRGWNCLLAGAFLYACSEAYPALQWRAGQLTANATFHDWVFVGVELMYVVHLLLAIALLLLAASTFFSRDRGYPWRLLYVGIAALFIFDRFSLRPTEHGMLAAFTFTIFVLPILTHGLGWIAFGKVAYSKFRKKYRNQTASHHLSVMR